MDLKKKLTAVREKIAKVEWKKLIGTKAFITVGCLVLVCAAVLIGTVAAGNGGDTASGGGSKILGNAVLVDAAEGDPGAVGANAGETAGTAGGDGDFFAMAILNRTQVRDSALEVLRSVAESPDSMPDAKESALRSISDIADEMNAEANIETLVRAKGIADCIAVVSGKTCSVIVNAEGLLPDELTQIAEIVYEQAGVTVENLTVVEAGE